MNSFGLPHLVLALVCFVTAAMSADDGGGAEIPVRDLQQICTGPEPNDAERSMADVLRTSLRDLYGAELSVVAAWPEAGQPAIVLGRSAAIAARAIRSEELERVKHDGYVIRGEGRRIALAGYAPQGTIYATYAFLRLAGLKLYPWRNSEAVEVRQSLSGGMLPPLAIASRPFFERRDLLGYLDRGRWGASLTEYSLGEFRALQNHEYFQGKGWLGGDHTAPYLVPMAKYYDEHPEYYAMQDSKRLPKNTENCRVALCLSNPAVHRIAAERALEWMADQNQRRFFHITDGDTRECRCPACTAMDLDPGSCTDRYLKWVNSVAGAVGEKHPENVVMALAYGNTTRPPLETKPAANVVVLYCPWYWTSRTTSATGWANPLNVTAMKEFTAWAMKFPDQVGLYDYPDNWFGGLAERLKFLAKRGVRVFYACGGHGDLYQWVNARLLWDPCLNTEDLVEEFVHAYYGPAADPMRNYLRLKQQTIERRLIHTREPFRDAEFLQRTAELMQRAEAAAQAADDRTKLRILDSVGEARAVVLQYRHPQSGPRELRVEPSPYRRDLEQFLTQALLVEELCQRLGNRYAAKTQRGQLQERLQMLGLWSQSPDAPADQAEPGDKLRERVLASFDEQLRTRSTTPGDVTPKTVCCSFAEPEQFAKWISDGSRKELISPPEKHTRQQPSGQPLSGVRIRAPLSALPVIPHGKRQIHAGRFYAETTFDPPLDATGCQFVSFHVHASADVPATIYINDVHSDVDLHAGEQIVRIDMRQFDVKGRFSYADWDHQLHRISLDIWPQDNDYPYPPAKDTDVTLFSMTASNHDPQIEKLPHRGQAIWLCQFRPNLARGVAVPRTLYDQYLQRQRYKHVGLDYGSRWISERFRTFTEHRAVTPIFAIVVSDPATPAQRHTAEHLQTCLEKTFGVRLPVRSAEAAAGDWADNAILLDRQACVASGRISDDELRYVGPGGFLINAHQGRIAIAGPNDAGTMAGVLRYLEDHGARFFEPQRTVLPDHRSEFLHELYLPDWPHFRAESAELALWQDRPAATAPAAALPPIQAPTPPDVAAAEKLAAAIKDVARSAGNALPPSLLQDARRSPLSRYVARRLVWAPTADATRLIREFRSEASRSSDAIPAGPGR
ncbi:MAG: DUF4838 domain-containing protein [Candidatus Anammoximicrobium sp.]|nr:DUF4838 domain-containing protein [Candidatus Anammoximicrobium sp.]